MIKVPPLIKGNTMRCPSFEIGNNIKNSKGKKSAIITQTIKLMNYEESSMMVENVTANDSELTVSLSSCILNQCAFNYPFIL